MMSDAALRSADRYAELVLKREIESVKLVEPDFAAALDNALAIEAEMERRGLT